MKILISTLFLGFILFCNAQPYVKILNHEFDGSLGNYHPQIVQLDDEYAFFIWTNQNTKKIHYAKASQLGIITPEVLNPEGVTVQAYNWSGADLTVDGNNIYIIYKQEGYETGQIYFQKSTDSGVSFGDTIRVNLPGLGFDQYPDIVAKNDSVFITYMTHDANGLNPEYVVRYSYDGANAFSDEISLNHLLGNEACDCCQPEITYQNGKVVVYFRNNDANIRDIYGAVSNDGGQSFTEMLSLDEHQWNINACPSTGPDAISNGNKIITAYRSQQNNVGNIYLSSYDFENSQLTRSTIINSTVTNPNYPQLSQNNVGEYFLIYEASNGTNFSDIFVEKGLIYNLQSNNTIIEISVEPGSQTKPDIAATDNYMHIVYANNNQLIYNLWAVEIGSIEELNSKLHQKTYYLSQLNNTSLPFDQIVDHLGRKVNHLKVGNYFTYSENKIIRINILP